MYTNMAVKTNNHSLDTIEAKPVNGQMKTTDTIVTTTYIVKQDYGMFH